MITRTLTVLLLALCVAPGIAATAAAKAKRPTAKYSARQANAVVLKRFHGVVVGHTKLENEEGKWQYGVLVRSGKTLREAMVDAMTGKIASVEVTTAAKERVEEKADAAKGKRKH